MNVNPVFFIILVELLTVESIVLGVIGVLYLHRKYRYRHVVASLIEVADATEANRAQVLEKTLKDVFNEESEEASRKAQQLAAAESRFCKHLISAFVSRKHDILSRLDKMTDDLLSPYRNMISETAEEKVHTEKEMKKRVKRLRHTIESLKEEKAAINHRLKQTEEELNNITSEYVSAFKKEELLMQEEAAAAGETADKTAQDDVPADETVGGKEVMDEMEIPDAEDLATGDQEAPVEVMDENQEDSVDEDDAELLKLDDIDDVVEQAESADTDVIEDDQTVAGDDTEEEDEIAIIDEGADGTPPMEEEETTPEAASQSTGSTGEPAAILDDVDMGAAPLSDKLAAENAIKAQRSAAR